MVGLSHGRRKTFFILYFCDSWALTRHNKGRDIPQSHLSPLSGEHRSQTQSLLHASAFVLATNVRGDEATRSLLLLLLLLNIPLTNEGLCTTNQRLDPRSFRRVRVSSRKNRNTVYHPPVVLGLAHRLESTSSLQPNRTLGGPHIFRVLPPTTGTISITEQHLSLLAGRRRSANLVPSGTRHSVWGRLGIFCCACLDGGWLRFREAILHPAFSFAALEVQTRKVLPAEPRCSLLNRVVLGIKKAGKVRIKYVDVIVDDGWKGWGLLAKKCIRQQTRQAAVSLLRDPSQYVSRQKPTMPRRIERTKNCKRPWFPSGVSC